MNETPYTTKMLGLVTLYNPNPQEAASNIKRYIDDVDALIIWDNSPLEKCQKTTIVNYLSDYTDKIIWQGDGQNHCIAPAINYAWNYAKEHGYHLLLIMDQDSQWEDFGAFRQSVEKLHRENSECVICPYILGNDSFEITQEVQAKRTFINSGSVLPVKMLQKIGGADEAFALDALDHDLAIRLQKAGFCIVCLTKHILHHTVGNACRMGPFHLFTNNYGPERTYSMAKAHIMLYKKHRSWFTSQEKRDIIKEHYILRFIRILLAEPQKWLRLRMFFKGMYEGVIHTVNKQ